MVDGNTDHRISKPIITMMSCIKIVTEAIQKKNTRDQGKIKIAILAIMAYASILMHSYKHTTKSVVFFEKTIKYIQYPSKIPWTFGY